MADQELELAPLVQGAEPYPLDSYTIYEAMAQEADVIASDAGSDLLAAPTLEERDALAARIMNESTAALRGDGDEYRAPDGTRYVIRTRNRPKEND